MGFHPDEEQEEAVFEGGFEPLTDTRYAMIFVQRLSKLQESAEKLEKQGYYMYFDKEFNAKQFILDLAKKLGRAYYKEHGFDAFMISDPNGNFKFYEKDSFVDAIGDEITVANPSDLVPRLKI